MEEPRTKTYFEISTLVTKSTSITNIGTAKAKLHQQAMFLNTILYDFKKQETIDHVLLEIVDSALDRP